MNLKQELDALIESTMAFANSVKRSQPIPDLSVALRIAEQTLAETLKPTTPPAIIAPHRSGSERDEIRQRVNSFKAHQEKMAREREDYYLQMRAKMLAPSPSGGTL
jgi:hypothetical protein